MEGCCGGSADDGGGKEGKETKGGFPLYDKRGFRVSISIDWKGDNPLIDAAGSSPTHHTRTHSTECATCLGGADPCSAVPIGYIFAARPRPAWNSG
jgi:hypothetical protein